MVQKVNVTMGLAQWLMLIVLSMLWGGSFFFTKVALEEFSPLTIVTLRVSLAAIVLWGVSFFRRLIYTKDLRIWLTFLVLGALNSAIPFSLIAWGQTEIEAGLASILNAATPIFTVILANVFLEDERISRRKVIGVVLGLLGVVILVGPGFLKGISKNFLAQLAVIGAAFCYGLGAVYARRFKEIGISYTFVATGQVTAASFIMIPACFILEQPFSTMAMPGLLSWSYVLAQGVFSTAVAYMLFFNLVESSGAVNAVLVALLVPVFANLLGMGILGESLSLNQWLGMVIIWAGLVILDGRVLLIWPSNKAI